MAVLVPDGVLARKHFATVQNSQHPEKVAVSFRAKLCRLIPTLLGGKKVSDDNMELLHRCVIHCITEFPQIFVIANTLTEFDGSGHPSDRKRKSCILFSKWLVQFLCNLITRVEGDLAEKQCLEMLVKIYQLVEITDANLYRYLCSELVTYSKDLMVATDNLNQKSCEVKKIEICRFFYKDYQSRDEEFDDYENVLSKLEPIITILLQPDFGKKLQLTAMYLLEEVIEGLCLCADQEIESVWQIICETLKNGDFPMRLVVLRLTRRLVNFNGVPRSTQLHTYLVNCLMSLTSLLASSQCPHGNADCDKFQTALADVLPEIVLPWADEQSMSHFKLVPTLIEVVTKIKCISLQNAIGGVVMHIVNNDVEVECRWKRPLLQLMGQLTDYQWLTRCLSTIICKELYKPCDTNFSPTVFTPASGTPQSLQGSPLVDSTDTWRLFLKKLEGFPSLCKSGGKTIFCLQCTCEILQAGLRLVADDHQLSITNTFTAAHQVWACLFEEQTLNQNLEPKKLFSLIINYAKVMLNYQFVQQIPDEISSIIFCMLLLPWMHETNLLAKLADHFAVARFRKFETVVFDLQDKIAALPLLVALPCSLESALCVRVLNGALRSADNTLQNCAIECLPTFFHVSGVNNFFFFENSLRELLLNGSSDVIQTLANVSAQLVCVLTEGAQMNWCSKAVDANSYKYCLQCSRKICGLLDPKIVEFLDHLWQLFFCHTDSATRLAVTSNLDHIFRHIVDCQNLLSLSKAMLGDECYYVRKAFCGSIQSYYQAHSRIVGKYDDLIAFIRTTYNLAQSSSNWRLKETIISTVGHLGQSTDDVCLLNIIVISLLENIMSPVPHIYVTAATEIRELAAAKKLSTRELFTKFRRHISLFLLDTLHKAQSRGDTNHFEMFRPLIRVFDFDDRRSFLNAILPDFLPNLVIRKSDDSSALVRFLALDLQKKQTTLLLDNFKYIFCYLICNCTSTEVESGFSFVVEKTRFSMDILLRCDCQCIYNELLLQMGTKKEQVLSALEMLAKADDRYSPLLTSKKDSNVNLEEFMYSRFLGFLVYFESLIRSTNVLLRDKQEALRSLVSIITVIGSKYITAVRMKLLSTLRLLLEFTDPEFLQTCGLAWSMFVRTLTISAVGPMLSQIVAALLPLLPSMTSSVVEILYYVVVQKHDALREHLHELYFIPELPELEQINSAMKMFHERPSSQSDLQTLIKYSLRGIGHENLEVRVHALRNLKNLLSDHRMTLHAIVLGCDTVDPILSQLVASLLGGCRDGDPQVRHLVGCCLGELGAIDPGRLVTTDCLCRDQVKLYKNVEDVSFAVDLISELTRSFLGARDTNTQDCSSYSIQEILHLYECAKSANDPTLLGGKIWSRLSEDTRENITPLLRSRYVPKNQENVWGSLKLPIFYNSHENTYHSWVTTWCACLTSKVRHSRAREVFCACIQTIQYDDRVALFLLPHVTLYVLQDGSEEDFQQIETEITAVLNPYEGETPVNPDRHHMSMQAVFTVLDYLTRWSHNALAAAAASAATVQSAIITRGRPTPPNKATENVRNFLNRIPRITLANASYKAQAYTRALMNLELNCKSHSLSLQNNLKFFQKIYGALDDPDGIAGVISLRKQASLRDQILSHESTGRTQDALAGYELAVSLQPQKLSLRKGHLQCLMDLDQPHSAMTYASGILAEHPKWNNDINQYRVECAWKLASWDQLGEFLATSERCSPGWGLDMGHVFESVQSKNTVKFTSLLERLRGDQMVPLSVASLEIGSYQRGYQYIVRLHMLDELEKGIRLFQNLPRDGPAQFEKMLTDWSTRKQFVQSSMRYLEPILNLRRVLLGIADKALPSLSSKIQKEIGRCWLHSAKVSRKCGHLQRAYSSLLSASRFDLPEVFLEMAKWHWQKGEHENSILSLQKVIAEHYSGGGRAVDVEGNNLPLAKTKLLLARYTVESGNLESSAIITMFREVTAVNRDWEDGHFYLAQYYDRIINTMPADKYYDMMCRVIKHFGTSLMHGCRFVYQSMPRMLSLWLDFGTKVADLLNSKKGATAQARETYSLQMSNLHDKIILVFAKKLPPYLYLTAFSQLISRICHSHQDVFQALKEIIVEVLITYRQQAVWMMMAVSKSSTQSRSKRCQEIFSRAIEIDPGLGKFLSDATKLADKLVELSNRVPDNNSSMMKVSVHFKDLLSLLQNRNFSRIIIPRQVSMLATLPTSRGSPFDHEPFPQGQVCFAGIEDNVEVMMSLQKPKKISVRGSDGKIYPLMCKPKDDLRKDCRLMEFNSVVNKFLLRDAESRRRQLHIRTYTVIPLNDECGMMEWVPNLHGLRNVLNVLYKERNLGLPGKLLQQKAAQRSSSLEVKLTTFKTVLLPRYPAVFSEWFLRTFPDPTTWYFARLAYVRTTAVMSMVGYILGLGDRHGENVLLDDSCGDTVHVDFNCLFNKGETFDWPELVPFRLTHNMIEAMGPLGYEGVYRKTCETTMRVMRKEIDTLMSLLKPFIYDPLVEWSNRPTKGSSAKSSGGEQGEASSEMAKAHVLDIELRLKGIIKSKIVRAKPQGLPLSIEGQVNHLIQEATDDKNLCQMYVGWAAYM